MGGLAGGNQDRAICSGVGIGFLHLCTENLSTKKQGFLGSSGAGEPPGE